MMKDYIWDFFMMIFYRTGWVKKVINDIKLTNFVYISPQWRPAGSLPSVLFLVYNKHCGIMARKEEGEVGIKNTFMLI